MLSDKHNYINSNSNELYNQDQKTVGNIVTYYFCL